jgi:hypothetical protein
VVIFPEIEPYEHGVLNVGDGPGRLSTGARPPT